LTPQIILLNYSLYNHVRRTTRLKNTLKFTYWHGLNYRPERNETIPGLCPGEKGLGKDICYEEVCTSIQPAIETLKIKTIIDKSIPENKAFLQVPEIWNELDGHA
jgi:hypothetical protein